MNQCKFSYPHCEQHLQCDEQFSDREIQCPNCHHLIHIPPIPGRPAEYNPESGKTWATFVPLGNVLPPKEILPARKTDRWGPPRQEPIFRGATEEVSIFLEANSFAPAAGVRQIKSPGAIDFLKQTSRRRRMYG